MAPPATNGDPKNINDIQEALRALLVREDSKDEPKDRYQFWETQPVSQFGEDVRVIWLSLFMT
jgi:hypothetical protein